MQQLQNRQQRFQLICKSAALSVSDEGIGNYRAALLSQSACTFRRFWLPLRAYAFRNLAPALENSCWHNHITIESLDTL